MNMSMKQVIILVFIVACVAILSLHLMNKQQSMQTALDSDMITVVEPTAPAYVVPTRPSVAEAKPQKVAQVIQEITTKAQLDELLSNTDKPVVVKFFAQWCPPCRGMKPLFEANAHELSHKAHFAEIDIDAFTDKGHLATFDVQTIPTIIFFHNGKEVERIQGIRNKSHIEQQLTSMQK